MLLGRVRSDVGEGAAVNGDLRGVTKRLAGYVGSIRSVFTNELMKLSRVQILKGQVLYQIA
jgi:hypothetical protein